MQRQGLATNNYDFLDSYGFDTATKPAQFAQLLRDLPEGLSEWALHPDLGTPELQTIEPEGWSVRQADSTLLSPSKLAPSLSRRASSC